jgi:hypothetical protein
MEFLSGGELTKAIKTLLKEPKVRCAVAFWGKGCDKWLKGAGARIICNLASGGTNPHALKKLKSVELRQYDALHAKVIIGKTYSIVSSANVSSNGLGFERIEQQGWHEAGVRLNTSNALTSWFENLWKEKALTIEPDDWKEAARKWLLRQQTKPTLPSFDSFDIDQNRLPVLEWYGSSDWRANVKNIEKQVEKFKMEVDDLISYGIDIEDKKDIPLLKKRWVLRWNANKDGMPKRNSKLEFTKISDKFVKGAYTYKGNKSAEDVLLPEYAQPPIPFNPNAASFRDAFSKVLGLEKYKAFRNLDYKGSYQQSCKKLIRSFWRDIKDEYAGSNSL